MSDLLVKKLNKPWGKWDVTEKEMLFHSIGDLRVWCYRDKNELKIAFDHLASENGSELPENITWHRWSYKSEKPLLHLKPIFPDRPVVVEPEAAFRIAEDVRVKIYVRVPVWLNIVLEGNTSTSLMEIPTVILSNTWFGTFTEGDLCYWISSGARREIEPDPSRPYLAICPLLLIDNSPEDLDVQKICLRVANLSLFIHEDHLWADETKINFKGETEVAQIEVTGTAPQEARGAKLIATPREVMKKAFAARTFSTLRDLPGLGLLSR